LPPPYWLLYVLVVPRGASEAGRYESVRDASFDQVQTFLNDFREFLEGDARHHLWIYSSADQSLLVYDKHNVIYVYGPLEEAGKLLDALGLEQTEAVAFPFPHSHWYHDRFDGEDQRLLNYWEWERKPLAEDDD
jgi:hypothetical protein